jgi:hypothetical protein
MNGASKLATMTGLDGGANTEPYAPSVLDSATKGNA